ncbi:MAG TPA: pitrilysin family protein [Bacteroidia bacterium]|jgi:predicted Zn-dependent peptidase
MKKVFASITAVLFVTALFAQQKPAQKLDRSKRPLPAPAPVIKLGNIQDFQLPNGLKVFVVENHKSPTIAYSLVLDVVPSLEKDAAGLANIASELLTSGTKTRSKDQLDNDIDFIGATLTASPTSLYAASLKKQNTKLLELMTDVLLNAEFKQEELDKIKTQTLSNLQQQKDDPDAISTNVKSVLNFGRNHPYGESPTEESVGKITLEKCNSYYTTYFHPNVAYLAIVGDVTLAEIKPMIEKYFGSWKAAEVPKPSYSLPAAPSKTRVAIVNKPGAVQSVINVTYPVDLKPNSNDLIKAKVLNTILGAGFSSRLFMNLREKHGYTYGSYSSLNYDELIGEFSAYAKVRNAVTDSSVTEIMYELNRLRKEKVPQEELEGIKNFLNGSFAISLEDPATVARFAINIDRYKLPKDYYENYLKNLAAVTSEDVYAMAQKYILPENATILVVGDQDAISKSLEKFSPSGKVEFYDLHGNPVTKTDIKAVPAGITPKSVIDAYVKAIGGEKALNAVKDEKLKLTTQVQGRSVSLEIMHKAPNKYSMSFNMGPMTLQKQTFDGTKGKQSGMQGKKDITGEELEDLKSEAIMNKEMQYEKLGYKLNLKGIEPVNNSEAYILEVVSPSGKKSTEWYDLATGYKVRSSSVSTAEGQTMNTVTDYSDYKDYNGIKYPASVSITGTPMPLKLQLESVEVNKGLKDTEFSAE